MKIYNLLVLALCFLAFKGPLQSATLHIILVGDTKDEVLNQVIKKDLKHMDNFIEELFDEMDLDELDQITYTGKDTNSSFLYDLAQLKVAPDDVIFFYFSGHGFYAPKENENQWPFLYLSREDSGVSQLHVTQLLLNLNARLTICFADCCNNILSDEEVPDLLIKNMPFQTDGSHRQTHLTDLFCKARGCILISSASPGFYAEGTDEKGSCFTNRFIKIFNRSLEKEEGISWEFICLKAQQSLWNEQQPQFQIMVEK
jgi:hypothetical protein